MSTETDERIDELSDRIDRLDARAKTGGAKAHESMKGQVDALRRQEASARAAADEDGDAAALKLRQLEVRLETAEHGLAAELAEDRRGFTDAMQAYVDAANELPDHLNAYGRALAGDYRDAAEADARDLRRSRDTVAERLAELREAGDDRWGERRKSVAAARAELDRKVDEAMGRAR
jgi:hypothetical protein